MQVFFSLDTFGINNIFDTKEEVFKMTLDEAIASKRSVVRYDLLYFVF